MIYNYHQFKPQIHPKAFIAPSADIIGNVTIGENSSVWFNAVVRGDVEMVKIGDNTNIQDGTVIHVSRHQGPTNIGSRVTIGHKALIHAATIHDEAFIGMGATMLDFSVVETHGFLAAGSMLTGGKVIKSGELWAGSPAKFMRMLTAEELDHIQDSWKNYASHAVEYLDLIHNIN